MKMQTPATPADTAPDPADLVIAQAEAWQRNRRRWLIAGGVVMLFVSYPLSVGPLFWLKKHGVTPDLLEPILTVIYFPIAIMVHNVPFAERYFRWYVNLYIGPNL